MTKERTRSWRRWLKVSLLAVGGLLVLLAGFVAWAYLTCFAEPPELDYRPAVRDWAAPREEAGRVRYGDCWFERREGCSLLALAGDPYTIGYANATLTRDLLAYQEQCFVAFVKDLLPGAWKLRAVAFAVLVNNRNLPDYVPHEYQLEIRGIADAMPDGFPEFGPPYHRVLNYHAAHDISHWVWDRPVVGCTAVAARNAATADGHLLVGRNFDFEGGRQFDVNKVIACVRPTEGHAFLSVSWPGMAGAMTGINDRRLYCSINGAHSSDRDNIGTPVSLVVRQVLQYADTLDDAIATIRDAHVFVSDSYLLADGTTGEAAVVEKSPGKVAVRRIRGDVLLQANHFECPEFADDEGNAEYRRVGTSESRRQRLAELVDRAVGRLDPTTIVGILRDRELPGDRPVALGNRSTINAMIGTHSVVADLTTGVLWVSRGPHQLGAYDAYRIDGFGDPAGETIPADPALASGAYARLTEARELITTAHRVWEEDGALGEREQAGLRRALELNPGDADALHLLAQGLEAAGKPDAALREYRAALAASPAFPQDREEIASAIRRLQS